MDPVEMFFRRNLDAQLRDSRGELPAEVQYPHRDLPSGPARLTARDVELALDRLWTRLALPEPLHDLRLRLRREEGL